MIYRCSVDALTRRKRRKIENKRGHTHANTRTDKRHEYGENVTRIRGRDLRTRDLYGRRHILENFKQRDVRVKFLALCHVPFQAKAQKITRCGSLNDTHYLEKSQAIQSRDGSLPKLHIACRMLNRCPGSRKRFLLSTSMGKRIAEEGESVNEPRRTS